MSQDKNNATAVAAVALQTALDAAVEAQKALPETATPEEKKAAGQAVAAAKKALSQATAVPKPAKDKIVKGKFLLSPTGRFGLAYNAGEEASLPELQALELEEAGYFKIK